MIIAALARGEVKKERRRHVGERYNTWHAKQRVILD